jgi:curved DNA-binding protein CbpA
MIDYYSVLGIAEKSSFTEIKNAYRKLSKKFHPDVNKGDKYFEDRFKEVLNAYEVLNDPNKRAKYDSERLIHRRNNRKGTRDDYSNEEYIKRQKDEIKKREEELRRKEEEFRRKEQAHTQREAKIATKINYNHFAYLLFVPFIIIVIVLVNKSGNSRVQAYPEKNTIIHDGSGNGSTPVYASPSNIPRELDILKIKDSDIVNNLIKDHWEGSAYQSSINEGWAIKLTFDYKNKEFKIEYPSLNCTGYWKAINATNNTIEFIEILRTGQNICNDGGKIVLKQLNNDEMEYLYYWPSVSVLDSKGEIKRVSKKKASP